MTELEMRYNLPAFPLNVTAGVGDSTIRTGRNVLLQYERGGLFNSEYGAVRGHLRRCRASAGSSSSPNPWAVRWRGLK